MLKPKGRSAPLSKLLTEFLHSEKVSGFALIGCAILSLLIANSDSLGQGYRNFWQLDFFGHSLQYWINDGLMAVFFLLVGLEIERELYIGELSDLKHASLPLFAAVGGMVVPACIHFYFNWGLVTQGGAGIPMATDIAFALGVLSLIDKRVPQALKIFLIAFAILDDLGAIIIIATFYTKNFSMLFCTLAMTLFALLWILNRLYIKNLIYYFVLALGLWYCTSKSGVHATISGVLLAFTIPFADGSHESPSYRLQHNLHVPVAFIIMPLFALANTAIVIEPDFYKNLLSNNSLGIMLGLFLGKPIGIVLTSLIAVKMKWSRLPEHTTWRHLVGAGFLGGIGFTMSIFITLLAFTSPALVIESKIAILLVSVIAAAVGLSILATKKKIHELS